MLAAADVPVGEGGGGGYIYIRGVRARVNPRRACKPRGEGYGYI